MTKQTKKLTSQQIDTALSEIECEQKAWLATHRQIETERERQLAATVALCRWIGENCYNRHKDRAARR